ncbi:MAG: hypothetical protein HXX13_14100 [Bacteroidetes bacterium]|nr:hypothetical protein [Bacteroidota bacterium]
MNTKALLSLTAADLVENPVWEYWIENNIELVRPSNLHEIREGSNIVYIVSTEFQFRNKSRAIGYCSPQDASGLDSLQPVMLIRKEHIPILQNTESDKDNRNHIFRKLGLEPTDIFPILFRTRAKCANEYFEGKITGFDEEIV